MFALCKLGRGATSTGQGTAELTAAHLGALGSCSGGLEPPKAELSGMPGCLVRNLALGAFQG